MPRPAALALAAFAAYVAALAAWIVTGNDALWLAAVLIGATAGVLLIHAIRRTRNR